MWEIKPLTYIFILVILATMNVFELAHSQFVHHGLRLATNLVHPDWASQIHLCNSRTPHIIQILRDRLPNKTP